MKIKFQKLFAISLLSVAFTFVLSLSLGSAPLSPRQVFSGLFGTEGSTYESIIIRSVRLPRLLAALTSGAGLSISGVILQASLGNSLASPGTIGVSSGAGLGAVLTLAFLPSMSHLIPITAFVFSFVTVLIILALQSYTGGGEHTLILSGVAVSSLFGAAISFVASLDTDVLSEYTAFSHGGFSGTAAEKLILPASLIFICFLSAIFLSGRISLLTLGDDLASGLGTSPGRLRTLCLLIACVSASSSVSFSGLIGFVGLIVPHITRRLVGENIKKCLITAPFIGASLTALSDLAGRTLFAPSEVSAGIIIAFLGAPFFLVLLLRRGKNDA